MSAGIKTLAVAAVSGLVLAACASTPLYGPQTRPSGPGYSETRLDPNQTRVSFTGRRYTSRERVEDALLYRAAEVTRQSGFSHFAVANRETEERYRLVPFARYPQWSFGWYWGGPRHNPWYDPFWDPWPRAWDRDLEVSYSAYADIVMLTPRQAAERPDALDAAAVMSALGPRVLGAR